jgi:hypothetical protein
MKYTRSLLNSLIACGVTLAMVSTLSAQTVQRSVKVVRIKGTARYSTGNNNWQPLPLGAMLTAGMTIQTGSKSYVDLAVGMGDVPVSSPSVGGGGGGDAYAPSADQNSLRIHEDSSLAIDKFTSTKTGADEVIEIQLDLQRGNIFGMVKKMPAASKYEVKIPNGVAGIRGTTFEIKAEGVVAVREGSVVLAYAGPDGTVVTQVVVTGQMFDARNGQITPIPPDHLQTMDQEAKNLVVYIPSPITFSTDHTFNYVSPTQGR